MAKGSGKSSATSATRKKHARKAVVPPSPEEKPLPKEKKLTKQQRGQKKKEPRVKAYIPPVKPAPVQPDPLETTGLAHRIPPDLLIVLRSFNKKAQVTKIRALEELQTGWIDKCREEGEDGSFVYALVDMVPVWLHHVSALFVHPSRRVRLLAAGVHASLLHIPAVRDSLLSFVWETASSSQVESILGAWYMAAHDVDRLVSMTALKAWNDALSFDDPSANALLDENRLSHLISFLQRAVLDPDGLYLYLNPPPPPAPAVPLKKGGRKEEPDPASASRSKAEEMEEDPQDRKARLRVSGLAAVRHIIESIRKGLSDDLKAFLNNPALWSSLYHARNGLFFDVESFGQGQPNVRKSAWALLQTILESHRDHLESLLPIVSHAVLRSVWVEPDPAVHAAMWQPMLKFLKEFPNAWELERVRIDGEDQLSDSEDSDLEEPKQAPETGPSVAYREFLLFLERGCSGSPLQGYPTVVIIVSTIPSSILASASSEPLADLFGAFWKVLDGRALSSLRRSATSAAFLSSLLECLVFVIKRVRNDSKNGRSNILFGVDPGLNVELAMRDLACGQIRTVWENMAETGKLRVEPRAAARLVAHTLISLNEVDASLFDATWNTLGTLLDGGTTANPTIVSAFLKVLHDVFKHSGGPLARLASLMSELLHISAARCMESITASREGVKPPSDTASSTLSFLVNMLDQFREGIFDDPRFADLVDAAVELDALSFLKASPPFLSGYLTYRKDQARCLRVWQALLRGIAQNLGEAENYLKPLWEAIQKGSLPRYLKPQAGEIDQLMDVFLAQALAGDPAYLPSVRTVLMSSDYFLSEAGYKTSVQTVTTCFTHAVALALSELEFSLSTFEPLLAILSSLVQHPPRELSPPDFVPVLPDIFVFAYVLPEEYEAAEQHATFTHAREIWIQWEKTASRELKDAVLTHVKARLKHLLCSTEARLFPHDIFGVLSQPIPGIQLRSILEVFPPQHEINELLDQLSPDAIHPSLAVITSLIPPASGVAARSTSAQVYDGQGFSAYARIVEALVQVLLADRQASKTNTWALRHFCALAVYAQDFLSIPSGRSPVFGPGTSLLGLESLVSKVEQVLTYVLTSPDDEGWRSAALDAALGKKPVADLGMVSRFLFDSIEFARKSDSARDTRVLLNVLRRAFHDVGAGEADLWMLLARKIEVRAPWTAMAIVSAVTSWAAEPPRLDRYRNELAASLLGIRPHNANTEGLLALTKLAASAPNPDSDVVFLPQPRAVNVAKACQQWITSDEDVDEDVESALTQIFVDLAPILQDVPGGHWDFIFDVLENNLENSSLADDTTLVMLARSLRLVTVVQDLALTNRSLRAVWEERRLPILTVVRDLAIGSLDGLGKSVPRSICRGLVLTIIQDLPSSLIDQDTLPKMSHLIMDSSQEIQRMAYQFLQSAAKKRTEYLVVEAGVDSEASFNAEIPLEILGIVQHVINLDEAVETSNVFGSLLGWMLIFDLFNDASLKVRMSYIEQLRNLDILALYFIPSILSILRLDQGPSRAFKLDLWAVNEFHVEFYEGGSEFVIPVLVAHLYYRALLTVPSLIHTWVLDCKDRQLSSSITNYTSHFFSPVIIQAEIAHVKSPEATAMLVDDNLSVKVASSVNEIVASYSVDEHQLEIKLKIPSDWPLHKIEVKDVQRVGVDENRWRAWILAVQQIIWSHNGTIVDGLGLFKKNVTLHFEGQVECAICYSIISVMDGTLPKKPCRTCKNRFHAGCLYKWFNTSHSSSCPLCRSDIF